jgi:hypothetical protein
MSPTSPEATPDASAEGGPTTPAGPPETPWSTSAAVLDGVIYLACFAAAGLIGGWIWSVVTPLPQVTKTGNNATVASEELAKQVGMDGWFFVIAAVGGLVLGVVLLAWRHRDPLLAVILVTVGGGLASWLMIQLGEALGPGDPVAALRSKPDGAHVSEQLSLHAHGVAWVWPIAAAFGALIYLWVLTKPGGDRGSPDTLA